MSEEERKAITQLLWYKNLFNKGYCEDCNELCSSGASVPSKDLSKSIEIILNLIQSKQKEIEKKDKIVDELEDIFYNYQLCEYEITDCTYRKCDYIADDEIPPCKDCIKQYFEKKVEGKQC